MKRNLSRAERKAERRAKRDSAVDGKEPEGELESAALLPLGSSHQISEGGNSGTVTFEINGLRREVASAVGEIDRQLIPYRAIQAVSHEHRPRERGLFGRDRVRALDRVELALAERDLEWDLTTDAERFVITLKAILVGDHPSLAPPSMDLSMPIDMSPRPLDAESAPGVADDLVKLADLHRQGMLSDDEFAAAKAKLLA